MVKWPRRTSSGLVGAEPDFGDAGQGLAVLALLAVAAGHQPATSIRSPRMTRIRSAVQPQGIRR
jgi:hypothetical protein